MAFQQGYPFDLKKFPEEEDILLTETDLSRKNVLYCRKEILQQMKCTQMVKEDYLAADNDPEAHVTWFHYHLQKCYTPYMDAVGCLVSLKDQEVQKMKREAGPQGWNKIKQDWIADMARKVGETQAREMWNLKVNTKQFYEQQRLRDGHLYGEKNWQSPSSSSATTGSSPANNPSYDEIESLFVQMKRQELTKERERQEATEKKSFWKFGR